MLTDDRNPTTRRQALRPGPDRPGFSAARLVALARERIEDTGLDLRGRTVLTEAATGVYVATPLLAALAGARRVFAFARDSGHGAAVEAIGWLREVAEIAGVADSIAVVDRLPEAALGYVDVVTNTGHLRPIDARIIDALPPHAVIALMFEAWERREADIDFAACARRNIRVVGVNERHAAVDVFSYLGPLAVRLLHDAGVSVYRSRIALVCDNAFDEPILSGLIGQGAQVTQARTLRELPPQPYEAVLVALKPAERELRLEAEDARRLAAHAPGTIVAQFWGDLDRTALAECGLAVWPPSPPTYGHMAILLSAIGPEAVMRLQAGGLKAAELALRPDQPDPGALAQFM
ncbi:hypothetical protein [Chenggangzhangella methanolivorans]|uniref:Uncharacterized protein n=1 Tax=Chenggangzhangella methanolivorans TaxID=1437009 RepID=A0A9E6UIV4_9HYPH|nr:hypothetical protein [Chenggangzhangella methanolivorans]QZO01278.1 hypothetical protein K6K41_07110 [Chenggangzhangella methanolivorans]